MMSESHEVDEASKLLDDPAYDSNFSLTPERIASLLVALAYLLISPILFPAGSWSHLMADILIRILSLAFPLACIWFSDDLAEYFRDGNLAPEITHASSGTWVRFGGWLLLLLPILIYLLVRLLDYLYG